MRLTVLAALAAALAIPGTASAAIPQLPDLAEIPPASVGAYSDSSSGSMQYELVFESGARNVGTGPLEIDGTRNSNKDPMSVAQRVYNNDGPNPTYTDHPLAGAMRYVDSITHQHWHYLGFEHYELRRMSDYALVGGDHKTGFCLGDDGPLPGAATTRYYYNPSDPSTYCSHDNPDALSVVMGITNGWQDTYSPQKEGQYIYVTGVPAGDYYLVNRVNEDGSILESDAANPANDVSSALIRLSWPRGMNSAPAVSVMRTCWGSGTCPEPNAQTGAATAVTTSGATLNGSVDPNGDDAQAAFDFGSTTDYGSSTAQQAVGSGDSSVPVSATVGGLQPATTYHFRLDAIFNGYLFPGADATFTTAPAPAPSLPQSPLPPLTSRPALAVRSVHVLRGGKALVRLDVPGRGVASIAATARHQRVAVGRRSAQAAGVITLTLRPTHAGLAALRAHAHLATRLLLTFKPARGARKTLHLGLKLRR